MIHQAGWISPVVVVNGRIEGVWKYEKARRNIVVTVELFEPASQEFNERINAQARRVGDFLGSEVETVFGPV